MILIFIIIIKQELLVKHGLFSAMASIDLDSLYSDWLSGITTSLHLTMEKLIDNTSISEMCQVSFFSNLGKQLDILAISPNPWLKLYILTDICECIFTDIYVYMYVYWPQYVYLHSLTYVYCIQSDKWIWLLTDIYVYVYWPQWFVLAVYRGRRGGDLGTWDRREIWIACSAGRPTCPA